MSAVHAERHVRMLARLGRGYTGAGMRLPVRRGRCAWVEHAGRQVLLRWSGELLPLPALGIEPGRREAEIVGLAAEGAAEVVTWSDVVWSANTVYHLAVVQIGGGGVLHELSPLEVITRATDGAGAMRGLLPNAPSSLALQRLAGNKPLLTWTYSGFREATPAASFRVFATTEFGAFDFNTPLATVQAEWGRTRYEWLGSALTPGDVRYFTVRAVSAAGVMSLIPRTGLAPSGDYDAVERERCPCLRVPGSPPAYLEDVFAEVAT